MTARIRRFFRGLSLVQKFSLAFIFLIFVMMVTVNTLIINHQKMSLRSEMEGNHLLIVNNLAKDALEPLISTDPLRLDELVRITDQTPGCLYAALVDQEEDTGPHEPEAPRRTGCGRTGRATSCDRQEGKGRLR
ncbi:MAG: hypothetical protein MZV70_02690 [Desulfobacterales bacterium]|nr:hypothetical protein [Desulfobacterales bacterium]